MKLQREARDTLLAWSALAAGSFAWFGSQQLGSNAVFAGCSPGDGLLDVLVSLLALLLVGLGGFLSLRVWRGGDSEASHPFVGMLGIAASALLSIAIILQGLAGLIIPSCFG